MIINSQKKIKIKMNTVKIYEEIPKHVKVSEKIKESLRKMSKVQKFKEMIKRIKGQPTYVKYSGTWNIYLDGIAYSGQIKNFEELKHGYGKMVDIFGRLVIGYFKENLFLRGVVFNTEGGVYEVNKLGENENYSNLKRAAYIYPNQDCYHGEIRNSMPDGFGSLSYENPKKMLNHNLVYKNITGYFKNGLPHGNCVIEYMNTTDNDKLTTFVEFHEGKMKKIIKNETNDFIYFHNCTVENSAQHLSLGISKFDGSVCFYGESSLTEQNGDGYSFSNEYIVHNKKYTERNHTTKKGLEFQKYTSSGSFLETDWRHDEQISLGKQFMRYSGVLIEAEWALSRNQNRIMEIRKVLTKQGGEYTRKGPEADQFVYMEIKEKMFEMTLNPNFDLRQKGNKYFVTINSAFNASIFSQIQICSGKTIKDINRMISYTISGISEGKARLDEEYYTGEFQGNGFKSQYLLNYNFKGKFISDEPTLGKLDSPFLKFNGSLKDYTLDSGEVELLFSQGFRFLGNLLNEGINGFGSLEFPNGNKITCEWKNGVCLEDPHIAIIHGDQKRKLHRYCLVFLAKNENDSFQDFWVLASGETIYRKNAVMLTSLIYNKKYILERMTFDLTEKKNLRIKKIRGKMETLSLTLAPFTEFERISNDSVNGKKVITKCVYHTKNGSWIKEGELSSRIHKITKVDLNNLQRGVSLKVKFEESFSRPGKLVNLRISNKERRFICDFLDVKSIEEDTEFRYGIFNELQERLMISKKDPTQGDIFKGKAVAYHLNGSVSYGEFYHNFLHGKGTRIYERGNLQKVEGNWIVDQTHGEVQAYYNNDAYYQGNMKFLERHGKGKIVHGNKEIYDGEWFAGLKNGYGRYYWPNGDYYEGEFKLNMIWGEGIFEFNNGEKVIGRFWKNEIVNDKKIYNQKWQSIEC